MIEATRTNSSIIDHYRVTVIAVVVEITLPVLAQLLIHTLESFP